MTLIPNTPITQENVALLKAGDWVVDGPVIGKLKGQADGWGCVTLIAPTGSEFSRVLHRHAFTYIGPDLGDGWIGCGGGENPVPGMRVDVRTSWFSGDLDLNLPSDTIEWGLIIAFRPALAKPSEGEVHERNLSASNAELIDQALSLPPLTPTPPSVDWERVGPKLVEALERIERWFGEFPETNMFWPNADGSESDRPMSYGAAWGSNGERDFMRSVARAALAAAQPEGK